MAYRDLPPSTPPVDVIDMKVVDAYRNSECSLRLVKRTYLILSVLLVLVLAAVGITFLHPPPTLPIRWYLRGWLDLILFSMGLTISIRGFFTARRKLQDHRTDFGRWLDARGAVYIDHGTGYEMVMPQPPKNEA